MIAPRRRPRAAHVEQREQLEQRAAWRATGRRILAFKNAPPGTSSADFNRRAAP